MRTQFIPFLIVQILKKYAMEVRKDVAVGQAVTFSAQAAAQKLLLNNQDKLTISPQLTRKGSFVVVISKEKINRAGGNINCVNTNCDKVNCVNTMSSRQVIRILSSYLGCVLIHFRTLQ